MKPSNLERKHTKLIPENVSKKSHKTEIPCSEVANKDIRRLLSPVNRRSRRGREDETTGGAHFVTSPSQMMNDVSLGRHLINLDAFLDGSGLVMGLFDLYNSYFQQKDTLSDSNPKAHESTSFPSCSQQMELPKFSKMFFVQPSSMSFGLGTSVFF